MLLGNLATSKLLEAGGPRARGGLGFSAAAVLALDQGRPLLPWPQELKFRPRREPGAVVKNLTFNEGDMGLIPGYGTNIPHVVGNHSHVLQ